MRRIGGHRYQHVILMMLRVLSGMILLADSLPAAALRVSGVVLNEGGRPVPGARVQTMLGQSEHEVTTGTDGAFVFEDIEWNELHRLTAVAPGQYLETKQFNREIEALGWGFTPPTPIAGDVFTTLTLAPGGSAHGRVLDEQGQPIEGARVIAYEMESAATGFVTTRSDAAGRYIFEGLAPGGLSVKVTAEGHVGAEWSDVFAAVGKATDLRDVVLQPGQRVRGRVVSPGPQGMQPEPGVSVTIFPRREPGMASGFSPMVQVQPTTTSAEGWFEVDGLASPGDYNVRLNKDLRAVRGEPLKFALPQVTDEPLELELVPEATIPVRVVDAAGEPVPGALAGVLDEVGAGKGSTWRPLGWAETRRPAPQGVDAQGRVLLGGMAAGGEYRLMAEAPGLGVAFAEAVAGTSETVTLALPPLARLIGRVVDEASGAPLAGLTIGSLHAQTNLPDAVVWTRTDSDGRFTLELREGPYALGAKPEDDAGPVVPFQAVALTAGEETQVELKAYPGATLRGRVVVNDGASSRPLEGVAILFLPGEGDSARPKDPHVVVSFGANHEVHTDAQGNYEVSGLLPGNQFPVLYKQGYFEPGSKEEIRQRRRPPLRAGEPLRLQPGERKQAVDFVLIDTARDPAFKPVTVQGRVLTPDGLPVVGVRVGALRPETPFVTVVMRDRLMAETDTEGRFSFKIWRERFGGLYIPPSEKLPAYVCSTSTETEQTLTLIPCARVSGQLLDAAGAPQAGVTVRLLSRNEETRRFGRGERWFTQQATTDAAGRFQFNLVEPGAFELRTDKPLTIERGQTTSTQLTAQAGDEIADVILRLKPDPPRRGGRLLNADGTPAVGWLLNGEPINADGSFEYALIHPRMGLEFRKGEQQFQPEGTAADLPDGEVFRLPARVLP